jgi:hypothetical protein
VGAGERATPGDGRVTAAVADGWRAILLRRPRWRSEAEIRVTYEAGAEPEASVAELGEPAEGEIAIDRAIVDARPVGGHRLAIEGRDGRDVPVVQALERVPGYAMIARRYRRA